jgi:hypothetical protein
MENFKEGQEVIYNGMKTFIEIMHCDETCNIRNPYWNWDDEANCVNEGISYDVEYWITVALSDLKLIVS